MRSSAAHSSLKAVTVPISVGILPPNVVYE